MNRQQKIATLQKNKSTKKPETVADYVALHKMMEATVADFKHLLARGIDVNELDVLIDRLEAIGVLNKSVGELKEAFSNFPVIPEEIKLASVGEFLKALESIKIEPVVNIPAQKEQPQSPDYTGTIRKIAIALEKFALATKEASKTASQRAQDFIPYRRVVKKGNAYLFDDVPTQQGGPSASTTPTRKDSNGNVYVPTANADGTPIGQTLADYYRNEDSEHVSGDPGIQALGVRKDTPVALAGNGDYQPAIFDAAGRQYVRSVADRPSQGSGRTYKTAVLSNQNADANLYTVTAGKTLYVTSITIGAFNTSTANNGVLLVTDGNGGAAKIPILMTAAGVAAQLAASAAVAIPIIFNEPLQFTSGVYMDITGGTINYSVVMVGYEE